MRRGVFGGSFDPVHRGHIDVVRSAADRLDLDFVHMVPTAVQPLKRNGPRASDEDRLAMLALATRGDPRLIVDSRELRRGGVSYTVDTLRDMHRSFPADLLFLMVGADAASEMPRWREIDEIRRLARIVVLSRPGHSPPELPVEYEFIEVPPHEMSASGIRQQIARGEPVDERVPDGVAEYIRAHGLYRNGD